jgi:hypothetical protein
MGKCANCGATLETSWKFCIACGAAVDQTDEPTAESSTSPEPITTPEPIPAVFRPIAESDDDVPVRKRLDVAVLVGVIVALGGGVLIIVVAIALFSPRG